MFLKKINAWLHLWLGLASGIIVFVISITGCILVFKQEIKSLTSPWLFAENFAGKAIIPPSGLHEAVSKVLPGKKIESIWYQGSGRTALVNLQSDSLVYVDPYSAKVTAMVHHEDFFDFIDEGHRRLWLPDAIGKPVVGWATLVFFILLLSGLVLWWPKKWSKREQNLSFKIKWTARFKRLNYDLHNVLGFYSLILAILFAVTGLIMSFSWFSQGVYWLSGGTGPLTRSVALSDTTSTPTLVALAQVDKAWLKGINELAEYDPYHIIISFPEKASDAIYICTDMRSGTWRDVYLDQHTLEELPASQSRLRDVDFATWLRRSNYGLHVGETGGIAMKIIYFLASLICASLPITGFFVWWWKRKKGSKRRKSRPEKMIQAT